MDRAELASELEKNYSEAWTWALSCCRWDPGSAEDVLQEALARVLSGKAIHNGTSCFQTWLFSVVRYVALEHHRAFKRRGNVVPANTGNPALVVSASTWPDREAETSELSQRLQDALARLPFRQREVLELVFFREFTLAEAAKIMGVREGTASTHYKRGKERLKRDLRGLWEDRTSKEC